MDSVHWLLDRPIDGLAFPTSIQAHAALSRHSGELVPSEAEGTISYYLRGRIPMSGPRLTIRPSGHRIYYGEDGRRVLCTDPGGTVLHECEWTQSAEGFPRLARARVRLDSLLWLGLIPEATTHTSVLDFSHQHDCGSMTAEDLRRMAARAWRVPLEDVEYFYPDSSLEWQTPERVVIQIKKDGLFLLEDGTFARSGFISYMGAIPWARIDLLNVVELFQSTLPGTGTAVFELIWGLCDDQRQTDGAIPLRYRGLPTYPSEPAYGLFCAFFRPEAPPGTDPHELFMDLNRANQIAWWQRSDPPWRYFDRSRQMCVTVQDGIVQKVTVANDPVGVPYVAPGTHGGFASCQRTCVVQGGRLLLRDGERTQAVAMDPTWGILHDTPGHAPRTYPYDWRAFFGGHPPVLDPVQVQSLALLYPDDDTEVAELSTQPFVLEQLYASLNSLPDLLARLGRIRRVLIDGFDAVAAGCIDYDYARCHTVLYRSPECAQKQAQVLWDRVALTGRLDAVKHSHFVPCEGNREDAYRREHDLIFCWIPFALYDNRRQCEQVASDVGASLSPGGLAMVVGPRDLHITFAPLALRVADVAGVEDLVRLPLLTEHLRLHPRTRLNPALSVFLVEKTGKAMGPKACLLPIA